MVCAAIICEYNPLHLGHLEQIRRIRSHFAPEDVTIIALMSGNFVQRGEPAIYPKTARAKAAILSGVNLVLELPFPYCSGSAKYFATSSVSVLNRLGIVDYLCFGSECGDPVLLKDCADRLASVFFEKALSDALNAPEKGKNLRSYAALRTEVYEKLYGEALRTGANDILGVEYLTALTVQQSKIRFLVLPRRSSYSATAARRAILSDNKTDVEGLIAPAMREISANLPAMSLESLALPILIHLRTTPVSDLSQYAEMTFDLASSLSKASQTAKSVSKLIASAGGKTYPDARVRRAILFSLLRVTKERLHTEISTVNLLGADEKGRQALRRLSKNAEIKIVTTRPDSEKANSYDFSMKADGIYGLASGFGWDFYKEKPFLL